jgi:hypothetical protein
MCAGFSLMVLIAGLTIAGALGAAFVRGWEGTLPLLAGVFLGCVGFEVVSVVALGTSVDERGTVELFVICAVPLLAGYGIGRGLARLLAPRPSAGQPDPREPVTPGAPLVQQASAHDERAGSLANERNRHRVSVSDRPAQTPAGSTAETAMLAAIAALVAGLALGASGPLAVVAVDPAFVAGPTWGGLALLLGVGVAILSGPLVLLVHGARGLTAPLFAASTSLVLGVLLGARLGATIGVGYWQADVPTRRPPFPSPPVYLHARGEASARFDGVAGFTTHSGSADCTSGPGSQVVATVDVWDAGELQGAMYRGDLHMHVAGIDPGIVGISIYFWSSSMTGSPPQWHGQGRLVTDNPAAGRVAFEKIAQEAGRQPAAGTWPAELSGEISWSCGPWSSGPATFGP